MKCGEEVLTPKQAPPLAAHLRSYINAPPVVPVVLDPIPERTRAPKPMGPLSGETIWYEDPIRKGIHSRLVRAGMERAKQEGRRIGRPRVTDEPGFNERFDEVVELLDEGALSRRKASLRLGIGFATLIRLLDARSVSGG